MEKVHNPWSGNKISACYMTAGRVFHVARQAEDDGSASERSREASGVHRNKV